MLQLSILEDYRKSESRYLLRRNGHLSKTGTAVTPSFFYLPCGFRLPFIKSALYELYSECTWNRVASFYHSSVDQEWTMSGGRVEKHREEYETTSHHQGVYHFDISCQHRVLSCWKNKVMATVATNLLVNGLSGKFGNTLMFKTLRGKTIVSAMARKPDKKKESNAQRNTRSTFREATQWAQHILYDPEKKAYYQQRARALKLPNAYTAAITDYMRKVKVKKLVEGKGITYAVSKPVFLYKTCALRPPARCCQFQYSRKKTPGTKGIEKSRCDPEKWSNQDRLCLFGMNRG